MRHELGTCRAPGRAGGLAAGAGHTVHHGSGLPECHSAVRDLVCAEGSGGPGHRPAQDQSGRKHSPPPPARHHPATVGPSAVPFPLGFKQTMTHSFPAGRTQGRKRLCRPRPEDGLASLSFNYVRMLYKSLGKNATCLFSQLHTMTGAKSVLVRESLESVLLVWRGGVC